MGETRFESKLGSLCKTPVTLLLHTGVCLFPSSGSWWAWLWNKWPHFPPSACGVGEGIGTYVLSGFEVQCLHLGVGLSSANSVSILSCGPILPPQPALHKYLRSSAWLTRRHFLPSLKQSSWLPEFTLCLTDNKGTTDWAVGVIGFRFELHLLLYPLSQ